MARREQIIFNGKPKYGFNIDESVGAGGMNKTGDILLIQAMFTYIAHGLGNAYVEPSSSPFKVPQLSGTFDSDTMMAILFYQGLHVKELLKADGVIHPGSYGKRNINPFNRMMTITHLHMSCVVSAKKQGHGGDYTIGMLRLLPNLVPWVINQVFHD